MHNLDELKFYYKELKELKLYFDNKQNKTKKKERKKKKLFLYSNKNFNKIIIYVILINLLFLLF